MKNAEWVGKAALLAVFVGVGLWLLVVGMRPTLQYVDSLRWPTTTGRVIEADVVSVTTYDGISYWPRLTYQYTVDGESFTGDQLYFGNRWAYGNARTPERIVGRYDVGQMLTVYYNPRTPTEAVVERRLNLLATTVALTSLLVAVLFVGLPASYIIRLFVRWRQSMQATA